MRVCVAANTAWVLLASRSLELASASFERARVVVAPVLVVVLLMDVGDGAVSAVSRSVVVGPSVNFLAGFGADDGAESAVTVGGPGGSLPVALSFVFFEWASNSRFLAAACFMASAALWSAETSASNMIDDGIRTRAFIVALKSPRATGRKPGLHSGDSGSRRHMKPSVLFLAWWGCPAPRMPSR